MVTEYGYPRRYVTLMMEVKNSWQVTPALADQVIHSMTCPAVLSNLLDTVPLSGGYPARLALYGYLVRNRKAYSILTTMK